VAEAADTQYGHEDAGLCTRLLERVNVAIPANRIGAASSESNSSGIDTSPILRTSIISA
jgi:hypothetical protein